MTINDEKKLNYERIDWNDSMNEPFKKLTRLQLEHLMRNMPVNRCSFPDFIDSYERQVKMGLPCSTCMGIARKLFV